MKRIKANIAGIEPGGGMTPEQIREACGIKEIFEDDIENLTEARYQELVSAAALNYDDAILPRLSLKEVMDWDKLVSQDIDSVRGKGLVIFGIAKYTYSGAKAEYEVSAAVIIYMYHLGDACYAVHYEV